MVALLVAAALAAVPAPACVKTGVVEPIPFSAIRYPGIRAHYQRAVRAGWPRVLTLNRPGAAERRNRLLRETGLGTMPGVDRDEYPPAVGRGRGSRALRRGTDPVGWKADVEYVDSSENRSHGASLGARLRPFCDGQRFRYSFRSH